MSGGYFKSWHGPQISAQVKQNVAQALGRFGLVAEGYAKKELTKGHGVETGTLRRSIHTAGPEYNWAGDNEEPGSGTPERGGNATEGVVQGDRITLSLGSGLNYALPVHQGHHSFTGYHYLVNGLEKARAQLPAILKAFQLK